MRSVVSLTIIVLGPGFLAAVMATALLRRRSKCGGRLGYARAARMIVAAALLAATLVTIGVLIVWR